MLKLGRAERLRETVVLPTGKLLDVSTDVESNIKPIIAAQAATIKALQEWQKTPNDEHLQRGFYLAYEGFLTALLGAANYKAALEAYNGDVGEMCSQFDSWVVAKAYPVIERASHNIMERRKKEAGKLERKFRRRARRGGNA